MNRIFKDRQYPHRRRCSIADLSNEQIRERLKAAYPKSPKPPSGNSSSETTLSSFWPARYEKIDRLCSMA